jgi:hypothetical protein
LALCLSFPPSSFSLKEIKGGGLMVLQHTFLWERRRRRNGRVSEKLEK